MYFDSRTGLLPALACFADAALDATDFRSVLGVVAEAAARLTALVEAAAAGWSEPGRAPLVCATDPLAEQLERVQYTLGEGPTLDACGSGSLVVGGDRGWARFGPRAGRAGFHSVLVMPVMLPLGVGWVSLYGEARDAFDERTGDLAQRFAESVAVQLGNAHLVVRASRAADQAVREHLEGAVIERAVGIVMSRRGGSPDSALATLRTISQRENTKLLTVATNLVDEAVNRAQSRPALG